MKISQVKVLLKNLKKDLDDGYGGYSPSNSQAIQYKNLFSLIEGFLSEHREFIRKAYSSTSTKGEMLSSLNYLEIILEMRVDELSEEEAKKNAEVVKFLDSANDKLKQAGVSFENQDYSGVSNNLNTAVELALKDALDIPSTIKGINTSKIIDVLISYKKGPVEYLKEVKNHVLMDNLVKHQGVSPVESRAVTAISSVENLFKKLKEQIVIDDEIKDKIWSGVE
ncbi:MAG: hypothetical protein AABX79_03180 [Nanoarchaeota archaeon]